MGLSDRDLARAIADAIPTSAQRELNPRQMCVLLVLTGGPLSIHQVRKTLGLSVASASTWVHETAHKGLVEVSTNVEDKRQRIAQLSAKGWVWVRDRRSFKRLAGEDGEGTDEDRHVDEREKDGPADLDSF